LYEKGNEKRDIEKYWDDTLKSLKSELIVDYLLKELDLEIKEEDIDNMYTEYAKGYLIQYGITNIDDNKEVLNRVKESLYKDKNLYNQIYIHLAWDKVVKALEEKSKPEEINISFSELEKLLPKK